MTESQASSKSSPYRARTARQPSSGYLFVVSGLAVFLAALVLGLGFRPRDPVKAVVAPVESIDRVVPAEQTELSIARLTAVADAIESPENISQTLELMGKFDSTSFDRNLTAEKFLRHFQVTVQPASTGGRHELLLDYRGATPGATEIVNQLATGAVQQYERLFERPARQRQFLAQQEATSAERKASVSLRQYEQFISRLRPSGSPASATTGDPLASQGSNSLDEKGTSNELISSPAMIQNPAWRELADRQSRLASRRRQLLEQMTIEHPVIRQLDVDLAQLDKSLSQTPRLIDNPATDENSNATVAKESEPDSTEVSHAAAPQAETFTGNTSSEAQIAAETKRLRAESVEADRLVAAKQTELQAAYAEMQLAQSGRLEVLRWAEKPALIRGSDGVTIIVAALLAWLIGSAVAARGVPADPTFTNPDEAATLLATPVLAVLPANEHCPPAIYPQLPSSTRWVARASELTLVAMLFLAITLVVADQSFRTELFSHPLSSIPHGIERFRDMLPS
jgi:hypothetical protein